MLDNFFVEFIKKYEMDMNIIAKKINLKINELKSDFEVNKSILHQGVKGGLNESGLSLLIKDIIPQKYKVIRGLIENSEGQQSNETDIIIYDDEILPPYIKDDLAFIPVEAVKYNFEVKSKLNATELKTTIDKFKKFHKIGGKSPTVLFSFSTDLAGNELSRYHKYDKNFHTNPAISVLCVSNKGYYYKQISEYRLQDFLSKEKLIEKNKELDYICGQSMDVNQSLFINGISYSDITFKIHQWIGLDNDPSLNNNIELSFLSGISNTLSKGCFGTYLINEDDLTPKILASCYEDMWGNISCKRFNEDGLDDNAVSFTFISNEKNPRIIFNTAPKKQEL